MRQYFILYLFAIIAIFSTCWSCHKEGPPTIITGKVTNKTTGEPVSGAYIDCSLSKEEWPSPRTKDNSTYSDQDGTYRLEIPDGYRFSFADVYKLGFLPNAAPLFSVEIQDGQTNIVDVKLIPTDGFVRLRMSNILLQNDSLYLNFYSPTRAAQPYIGGALVPHTLPIIIDFGSFKEEVFALPSEEFVRVHWGYKAYMPSINSPFQDSIYLVRNDTVDFTIQF